MHRACARARHPHRPRRPGVVRRLHPGLDPVDLPALAVRRRGARPAAPPRRAADVIDGSAWVGLIPFALRRVTVLGTPPLPYLSSFLETNVRTYTVGPDGTRGVFFLTLEADRLVPVLAARASYRLPYPWARMSLSDRDGQLT